MKTEITYCCIQCGNQIKWWSALYGTGLCKPCAFTGKNSGNWKGGKPKCKDCGKPLSAYHAQRCILCSNKKELNHNYNGGKPHCIDCGNLLSRYDATRCKSCQLIFQIGKNHPRYVHGMGTAPYPLKFNDRLRNKIRNQDNYKCSVCKMTQSEHYSLYNTNLEVHHIDYNKENCQENNLTTTCKRCNVRANFNRDYWYAYFLFLKGDKDAIN